MPYAIEMVPIADLHPYPGNPRAWTPTQLENLKIGIKRNGWLVPIVVNYDGTILSGHMRVDAAMELGETAVPGIRVDIRNEERIREVVLRLNQNQGSWDFEKLKDFDVQVLSDIGFDPDELAGFWDDLLETEDDQFDTEKELAAIKEPKAKLGDLYQLGAHRLIVGDSTLPDTAKRLMGGEKVSFIDTDPKYCIGLDYDKGVSGKKHYGGKTDDDLTPDEYADFLRKLLQNALAAAERDAHVMFWCDQNWVWLVQNLFRECGVKHQRLCWWLKGNWSMTPQVAFNKAGECAVYGTIGRPRLTPAITNLHEVMDKEVGPGARMFDDILDMFSLWMVRRIPGSKMEHPTQRDPTLYEKALRRTTRPGDRVLDLCGGSGSLLIACEQMKRRAYVAEIEPLFADLIIRRFESLTGLKASLLKP